MGARVKPTRAVDIYRKERGWGYELWIENCVEYCGKLLFIAAGKRCSLHFHMQKKETMYLASGRVLISMIDPDDGQRYPVTLDPGDSVLIMPGQVHQIHALEDSFLYEFSTMHREMDSYRVEKGD